MAAKKVNVLPVQFIETESREGKGCTLSNNRTFWKRKKLCRQLKTNTNKKAQQLPELCREGGNDD